MDHEAANDTGGLMPNVLSKLLGSTVFVFLFAVFGASAQSLSFPFVPDSSMTTGSACSPREPDFERFRYDEKIAYCKRNVASSLKQDIYAAYGVSRECQKNYTIDHFFPLSLGGTNRRNNLWPEAKSIKALRQNLEYSLFRQLEDGEITQRDALDAIVAAKLHPPIVDPAAYEFCL